MEPQCSKVSLNNLMRFFFVWIVLIVQLYSITTFNEGIQSPNTSYVNTIQTPESINNIHDENLTEQNSSEYNNTAFTTVAPEKKQTIFLSYEQVPRRVFVGQIFPIKVKALIATEDFDEIKDTVIQDNGVQTRNIDDKWKWQNNEIFYKTFYFKVLDKNATFPKISLELYQDNQLTDSQIFPPLALNIINLNADKYFSNVIASSLEIIKSKTTNFDEKNLITVLEIEAKNSNLKDFKLSTVLRDGIDSATYNAPKSKIYYYAIIPKHTENLTFSYFNTRKNSFEKLNVKIIVDDDQVSTQSNLNPTDNNFKLYKDLTYGVVILGLLILLLRRRKLIYFLLLAGTIALFVFNMSPLSSIKIASNTKVLILPTQNSTVFFVTPRIIYAQKIKTINHYIKIILPNGKIGWIKDSNVIEN
ncbi:hypothetical protein [Sulfurospirillum sp. 1612]|uniref:hypothetical protein n=1 Tax=Sulfurospirillum sp. 1612 TaxID=3094835 RepID=UPI002F926A37